MNDRPPRLVGNRHWREFASSPLEALERGVHLDAMTRLPGVPDFQPRGVFRGTQTFFDAMDADITVENLFKQRKLAVKSRVDSVSVFFTHYFNQDGMVFGAVTWPHE